MMRRSHRDRRFLLPQVSRLTVHALLFASASVLFAESARAQSAPAAEDSRQSALALEQQGRSADAVAAWQRVLKTHPSSSEAYAHLGLLEALQEHYPDAISYYRKALALHPAIPGLRLNLGLALFKNGQMAEALGEFTPLLKTAQPGSPDRPRLVLLIAMCHYGLGEYAKAVPLLKEASQNDPQNLEMLLALAHSCLWSKQYPCVMDTYHKILGLNAESAEADMLAGEALDEMKDVPGAIAQFRAAVKADPTMPDVHFGLGYLLWTKRQYPEAAPEFLAELNNNPHHVQALTYLGDVEVRLHQPDHARPLLEKALSIDPKLELAYLDLATIDSDAGRGDDALKELTAAATLAPNDVDVHWRLGRLYRSMGKLQEAKAELDKAKSITQAADTALIDKMTPPPTPTNSSPAAPTVQAPGSK